MPTGERFAVTAEIVSAITSSLVLEEVLASVARRTAEALDLWECDIYDYDAGENRTTGLRREHSHGNSPHDHNRHGEGAEQIRASEHSPGLPGPEHHECERDQHGCGHLKRDH